MLATLLPRFGYVRFWQLCLFAALVFGATAVQGQEEQLAKQYLENGEFEKAATLFATLHAKFPQQEYYFTKYVETLVLVKRYADAESEVKKQLKATPQNLVLYIALGDILAKQEKKDDAEKQYRKAIASLTSNDPSRVLMLKDAFVQRLQYTHAIETLTKGGELMGDKQMFAFQEAEIWRQSGEAEKAAANYLTAIEHDASQLGMVEMSVQRYFTPENYAVLQTQLYTRLQDKADQIPLAELLVWVLSQQKNFKAAMRQVKALDRRLEESGIRVYNMAQTAEQESDYDTAVDGFDYILTKGKQQPFYVEAQKSKLRCLRKKLTEEGENGTNNAEVMRTGFTTLVQQYSDFVGEYGWNTANADLIREWAKVEVFHRNHLPEGIHLLDSLIHIPRLQSQTLGQAKIELGDYYLMHAEPWEATLLYGQVDKAFKEDTLGELGRYKNARLSYYNGDFEWAQTQLGVLKGATSDLISNDAIDLSVFILENLGTDTTSQALKMYAAAELLTFQNRYEEAMDKLDSLQTHFPKHDLDDDILYAKAQIYKHQQNFAQAATMYQRIIDTYPEEIRADNAIMELAALYEHQLNDKAKAQALYEKIITNYSGSTFIVEARKRFRALRGDKGT